MQPRMRLERLRETRQDCSGAIPVRFCARRVGELANGRGGDVNAPGRTWNVACGHGLKCAANARFSRIGSVSCHIDTGTTFPGERRNHRFVQIRDGVGEVRYFVARARQIAGGERGFGESELRL